jgi:dolichol-phosphate mannosyltransferase
VVVLDHQGNKGLGEALNTGINYVLLQEYARYLCVMDGDMTQHPVFVHSMVMKLEEEKLDCVIASRYRHGSRIEGLSFFRRFLSFGARALYTYKLRVPGVRDYTCGYRLYSVEALRHLQALHGKSILKERSFACMLELLIYLHKEGCRLGEVPFVLKYQMKHGHSKMRVLKTIGRSLKVLRKI